EAGTAGSKAASLPIPLPPWKLEGSRSASLPRQESLGSRLRLDLELQAPMGLAQGRLHALRAVASSEDEAQIPRALRRGDHSLTRRNRDPDVLDLRHLPGLRQAPDLSQDPGLADRDHHGAGGLGLPVERFRVEPEGMAENQL